MKKCSSTSGYIGLLELLCKPFISIVCHAGRIWEDLTNDFGISSQKWSWLQATATNEQRKNLKKERTKITFQ